jgi:hypothetical protein
MGQAESLCPSRGWLRLFVPVALALSVPSAAEAQGSTGAPKPLDQAVQNELTINLGLSRGIEITDALLEDFSTGLRTEFRLWEELLQALSAYKSSEEYQVCSRQVANSPEWLKILMAVKIPPLAPSEELERIEKKLNAESNALVRQKCGADIEKDWPMSKRRERAAEIEAAGAAAFDAARAARATRPGGPAAWEASWTEAPSDLYYALKDKILSFCEAWRQGWIIDDKDGQIEFSFSTALPLSLLYTQAEARAQLDFCIKEERRLDGNALELFILARDLPQLVPGLERLPPPRRRHP